MEEVAELQALLMHGRIAKPRDAHSAPQVLAKHLASLVESATVDDANSEEAMRAQQAAEQLLGPPADA